MDKVDKGSQTLIDWLESDQPVTKKMNRPAYPDIRMFQCVQLLLDRVKGLEKAVAALSKPQTKPKAEK